MLIIFYNAYIFIFSICFEYKNEFFIKKKNLIFYQFQIINWFISERISRQNKFFDIK